MVDRVAPFLPGDRVRIVPLKELEARVVAVELDEGGWTVVARYIHEGEAKTMKCFPDELVAGGAVAVGDYGFVVPRANGEAS